MSSFAPRPDADEPMRIVPDAPIPAPVVPRLWPADGTIGAACDDCGLVQDPATHDSADDCIRALRDALAAARAREGAVGRSLVMVADGSLALEATCALCGHEWRRHDPESGCCDAPHPTEARVCPCGRDLAWMQAHIAEQSTAALRRARDGEGRGEG